MQRSLRITTVQRYRVFLPRMFSGSDASALPLPERSQDEFSPKRRNALKRDWPHEPQYVFQAQEQGHPLAAQPKPCRPVRRPFRPCPLAHRCRLESPERFGML
jgi:hypothetical protein